MSPNSKQKVVGSNLVWPTDGKKWRTVIEFINNYLICAFVVSVIKLRHCIIWQLACHANPYVLLYSVCMPSWFLVFIMQCCPASQLVVLSDVTMIVIKRIIIIIIIIIFWPRYSIPREEKLCYAKTKYENKLEWSLFLLLFHKTIKK